TGCDRGDVRAHPCARTRTGGTGPARHPAPEAALASAGIDGAARPPWIPRGRPLAALAGASTRSSVANEADAPSLQPTVATRPEGSRSRGGSAPKGSRTRIPWVEHTLRGIYLSRHISSSCPTRSRGAPGSAHHIADRERHARHAT